MRFAFDVATPRSLPELLTLLEAGDDTRLLAGGTALTIMISRGLVSPERVIDIQHVDGLGDIEHGDGETTFGSLVPLRSIELDSGTAASLPVLVDALRHVANVRVRNAATIGGNICEADYASDPPAVLMALGASVRLASPGGERIVALDDGFFQGFYETIVEPDEVLTAVVVPHPPAGARATYIRYVSRSAEDRPCVGVAAVVRSDPDTGMVRQLRVIVGGVAETPQRFPDLESRAVGARLEPAIASEIAAGYAEQIDPIDDIRGSAWYRRRMIDVFVRRALAAIGGEPSANGLGERA
jgi:carbon-monoxide dehydrogenase medium subunit